MLAFEHNKNSLVYHIEPERELVGMSKCDDGRFPHLSDVTFDVLSHCLEKFTGCHARTHRPTNCQAITIHVPGRRRPAILNMHYTRNFTHHSISTGRMLFLMPNQQCQSTEGQCGGMLVWLCVWSKVQIVCIWSSWCHCYPKTPTSLASFKSRLVYLSGTGLPRLYWKWSY